VKLLKSGRAQTYSRPLASKSGGAFALPALPLVPPLEEHLGQMLDGTLTISIPFKNYHIWQGPRGCFKASTSSYNPIGRDSVTLNFGMPTYGHTV